MVTLDSIFGSHRSGVHHLISLQVYDANLKANVNVNAEQSFLRSANLNDHTGEQGYLHGELAPAYGTLTSETIKAMDDHLKLMIVDVMHALAERRKGNGNLSWDDVLSVFAERQPQTLEHYDTPIDRTDSFTKPAKLNFFKVDGSPDPTVVREVESWFTRFISDTDVLQSTQIDIQFMASIVAQTGATIEDIVSLFYGKEYHEKDLVDIVVLRFPDFEHPYFKAFRIKLCAWSLSERILFVQKDQSGIKGEYTASTYRPTKTAYDSMTEQMREDAIQEAEDIFS
ncbi:hypothetical protein B0H13DRAFT_2074180 [Mycena leptocephala]|nr:hypothetical protein B0H13DRAFT_2074180 [Mycena leptocephala]